jgi:WD40 repeat protein
MGTGDLLRAWDAHYGPVTRLAFTEDDAVLLSAADDATVHVWAVTRCGALHLSLSLIKPVLMRVRGGNKVWLRGGSGQGRPWRDIHGVSTRCL